MSKFKPVLGRSKRRKGRSTDQGRAQVKRTATVQRDGSGVTTMTVRTRSGAVTVVRSSQTGRFTTEKSAAVIDTGAQRFAGALKRLAEK